MVARDVLTGEVVRLTPTLREDVTIFGEWFDGQKLDLIRFAGWEPAYPFTYPEELKRFELLETRRDRAFNFTIRRLVDDAIIGNIVLRVDDWVAGFGEFGIHIGETSIQGQGYGSDAVHVLLKFAFLEVNLNRVGLTTYSYNTRAIRAYEKVGFRHEGRLREIVRRDGEYHDEILMSMLRDDWLEQYHADK